MQDQGHDPSAVNGDAISPPLSVERIPRLVREVDALTRALDKPAFAPTPTDLSLLSASIEQRIHEVDTFRLTLRPGPLQGIVGKQSERLQTALHRVDTMVQTKHFQDMKQHKAKRPQFNSTGGGVRVRAPKPIYKWEQRPAIRVERQSHSPSMRIASHNDVLHDDLQLPSAPADEATIELRPCAEPGHYVRSQSAFAIVPENHHGGFEFQIVMTEEELRALKFQRRQLAAEHKHCQRRQGKAS